MSSTISLAQPAYTNDFMKALLEYSFPLNSNIPPQPNGYQVNVLSTGSMVDQTTDVQISGFSDQYSNGSEVTTVTFLATFSNTNSYQFNEVQFYTQVNGQNFLEVADFVFSSTVSKPSGYVLVLSISFSISASDGFRKVVSDAINQCQSVCTNVDCYQNANNLASNPLPFFVGNFVFIYLLGVTINYLKSLPNIQQYAQQYTNCLNQCNNSCQSTGSNACSLCPTKCQLYLESNPIAIYIYSQNISNMTDLLPIPLNNSSLQGILVNFCNLTSQSFKFQIGSSSINQYMNLVIDITIPTINGSFGGSDCGLQVILFTNSAGYYTFNLTIYLGATLQSGTTIQLIATISQSS